MNPTQYEHALKFRQLNQQGEFLLANAWDCASARVQVAEGFPALGTTSGGIAYARGFADAELIGREAMVAEIARICAAVPVPVTADIEAGYGAAPEDVATTVRAVIAAGAVGINLEDRIHGQGQAAQFDAALQAERLRAARAAADGAPLWINARIDSWLLGEGGDLEQRLALTVARAQHYLAAGADMVFVPGLIDTVLLRRLADAIDGPLSVMVQPGAPSAAELFAAGARRVSLGVCPILACMGQLRDIAREARQNGRWQLLGERFYGFAEAEALQKR
ncbi:isocitrate lyase/phosphoenolpyruvate mutase family protein [Paucibacter sp. APW11]|uniref:Isocitrate lyase/phosphoenolpyruvate mutase family protein n=1 Tax=Roseateles aquae TaxID=3077235 RepID=A0ABU3P8J9_9BURK|nr:isocitrate lyase/phosphoenolpyruvate mutase family protein [Paucibacter sp. APW11]MDT8998617.1 isocitrate lyase/phosphoenolpyruvate mutase family protein [Paucibacter sp. APW11]